nr:MAG TPA: Flagellar and Swarming motility protein [Caudoviricetes sp.]
MKFIRLTDANQETRKYTININDIACIETYVNDDGKLFTWVHGHGIEVGQLYVKETEEEILQTIEQHLNPDNLYLPLYPNS